MNPFVDFVPEIEGRRFFIGFEFADPVKQFGIVVALGFVFAFQECEYIINASLAFPEYRRIS